MPSSSFMRGRSLSIRLRTFLGASVILPKTSSILSNGTGSPGENDPIPEM